MRRLAILLALTASPLAAGEPALGDGHWGPLNLRYATLALNRSAALAAPAGGNALEVSTTAPFSAGDLVMVYQAQDALAVDSGTPGPFDLRPLGAGRWELARVAAVDGGTTLALAAPLGASYPAGMAQVLVVPEYTTVTVSAGSTLLAPPWNGSTGGVVAFLAQGAVVNDGEISATGAGFRGGVTNSTQTCTGSQTLDGPPHAGKGEGVAAGRYGPSSTARGNVANGGGGGNTCNAGGGGGGNGGEGGAGGWAAQSTSVNGGLGGGALAVGAGLPDDRLPFGGGGGAGQSNVNEGGIGGRGGGVVWIRALELRGSGLISADGITGADAGPNNPSDGAGGGGAGGTISVRVAGLAQCGLLRANGGDGGDTPEFQATGGPCGPGGGGGGGRIVVQADDASGCQTSALGGQAGVQPDPTWPVYFGATPDGGGRAPYVGSVSVVTPGLDAGLAPPDAGPDAGADGGAPADAGLPVP
ncbi:MAG TPA: hypothetical protein VND93_21440, partial [Myxococcales bacterium]|nr:hypothetical protein [Myxococcales bacterium]